MKPYPLVDDLLHPTLRPPSRGQALIICFRSWILAVWGLESQVRGSWSKVRGEVVWGLASCLRGTSGVQRPAFGVT
jgi:hypothetical protein